MPRRAALCLLRRRRPLDQRIWCTLGFALASAEKEPASVIAALERAPDMLPAAEKLRELYTTLKDTAKAQHWATRAAALAGGDGKGDESEEEEEEEDEDEAEV